MIPPPSSDLGALARRLREDAGLGVRALASELGVTFSAVARAERGDPALASLAERAVAYLLRGRSDARAVSDVVNEEEAPYGWLDDLARGRIVRLLTVERGWRRALVRGVMEEHGFKVETGGATLTARTAANNSVVLRVDLDRFVIETREGRLRPLSVSPYDRVDRESWGRALEQLAAFYKRGEVGWAESEEGFDVLRWVIDADKSL